VADALTARPFDLIHVATAGPAGTAAAAIAAAMNVPVIADAQPEFTSIAELYCPGSPLADETVPAVLAAHYARCRLVLSPGSGVDARLARLGVGPERIARWEPGVDLERYHPAHYTPDCLPDHGGGRFNVLYTGRLAREQGVDLLCEAFLIARDRDPRLHLVLAGSGPRERALRSRLGPAATFLGWVAADALAQIYASADLFVYTGPNTRIAGDARSILEAQASGLPVLATSDGGVPLIESGRTGCVVEPEPEALASAIRWLARRAAIRERLATGGLLTVRRRSWRRSTEQLAGAYALALHREPAAEPAASEHSRAA
jgi:phosphatidylinositol alpha 1,6-mannosyltransferase